MSYTVRCVSYQPFFPLMLAFEPILACRPFSRWKGPVMVAFSAGVSLRSKRFQLSSCAKFRAEAKKKKGPLPLPRHFFFFFALVSATFSTNSRGNTCYAGYAGAFLRRSMLPVPPTFILCTDAPLPSSPLWGQGASVHRLPTVILKTEEDLSRVEVETKRGGGGVLGWKTWPKGGGGSLLSPRLFPAHFLSHLHASLRVFWSSI